MAQNHHEVDNKKQYCIGKDSISYLNLARDSTYLGNCRGMSAVNLKGPLKQAPLGKYMRDCQNYGPFLGPYYNTGPNTGLI